MNFKEALKAMKGGFKVRLPNWKGYWYWNTSANSIYIHTKDGEDFDIRQSLDMTFTLSNVATDEWEIVKEKKYMTFDQALKYLKEGKALARKEWNNDDLAQVEIHFLPIVKITNNELMELDTDCVMELTNDKQGASTKYEINIKDIMANDWYLI